jgi:hypothetical protein
VAAVSWRHLGQHREHIFRIRDTRGILGVPGQGVLATLLGLVRIAQDPQGSHQPDEAGNPGIEPTGKNGGGGRLGRGELEALLEVGPGGDEVATIKGDNPHRRVPLAHQDWIGRAGRQIQELLAECMRQAYPSLGGMKHRQA